MKLDRQYMPVSINIILSQQMILLGTKFYFYTCSSTELKSADVLEMFCVIHVKGTLDLLF